VPISSTELSHAQQRLLLDVARESLEHGLAHGRPLTVVVGDFAAPLREPRASFVTLHRQGRLRGCIGTLEAHRPLVVDVAANAYAAAFSDPRFPPLSREELADLDLSISILSPPQQLAFDSEEDLRAQLRPGVDGLILQDNGRRGTFLPSVWSELPDRRRFLEHLKLKAGLPGGYWSDSIRAFRYTVQGIGKDL
jgi:AmmeMemoRadiSam system protein A